MFDNAPPKKQRVQLGIARRPFGHHLEFFGASYFVVALLQQERIGAHTSKVPCSRAGKRLEKLQQTQILLFLQQPQRVRWELRSDNHFAENFRDGIRACQIQWPIDCDDAAERRLFVCRECFIPSFPQTRALPHTARIRVLKNR